MHNNCPHAAVSCSPNKAGTASGLTVTIPFVSEEDALMFVDTVSPPLTASLLFVSGSHTCALPAWMPAI